MNNFIYENKTKVFFGKGGVKEHLGALLKNYGDTVLLAYGCGSIQRNGVYDEVVAILNAAGKRIIEFPGIMPNPTYAKVQEGAKLARENHVDLILAVGGGSVSDCCKIVSAQALSEEDIWTMEMEKHTFSNKFIPLGTIVTVFGTGVGGVHRLQPRLWSGSDPSGAVSAYLRCKHLPICSICQKCVGCADGRGCTGGIEALAAFIREIGLPTTFAELGIPEDTDLRAVADSTNITAGCCKKLTHDAIYEILLECK